MKRIIGLLMVMGLMVGVGCGGDSDSPTEPSDEITKGPNGQTLEIKTEEWDNGNLKLEYQYYRDGGSVIKHGNYKFYRKDGALYFSGDFFLGKPQFNGEWNVFRDDGRGIERIYRNGKLDGRVVEHELGNIIDEDIWENDVCVEKCEGNEFAGGSRQNSSNRIADDGTTFDFYVCCSGPDNGKIDPVAPNPEKYEGQYFSPNGDGIHDQFEVAISSELVHDWSSVDDDLRDDLKDELRGEILENYQGLRDEMSEEMFDAALDFAVYDHIHEQEISVIGRMDVFDGGEVRSIYSELYVPEHAWLDAFYIKWFNEEEPSIVRRRLDFSWEGRDRHGYLVAPGEYSIRIRLYRDSSRKQIEDGIAPDPFLEYKHILDVVMPNWPQECPYFECWH